MPLSVFADNYFMEKPKKSGQKQFPWPGRFETKAEIDEYFSGDKVQCLLCSEWYKTLHTHLVRIHEIAVDDYRERYGLPWKRGLCVASTSEKLSKKMARKKERELSDRRFMK